MKFYYVYILFCNDKTYYTGMTNDLERRLSQHKSGHKKESYTASRLPVKLLWYLQCENPKEAIKIQKQIKGWSQRKKKALIEENWQDLIEFSKNYTQNNNRI
ncbi:GIY-YIG nuclease family protein [Lacinutrix sp. MEBiC02595]